MAYAAGDIACDPASPSFRDGAGTSTSCRQRDTSDLILADPRAAAVFALGDTQYESGTAAAYAASYDPSWGRLRGLTHPAVGNHEYNTPRAADYFAYFGAAAGDPAKGWYSFDLGAWHVVVLNSNCSQVGGCTSASPQGQWLAADLAAHPLACTLAYFHHPRFSSGSHGGNASVAPFWQLLYDAGADLVLGGHDHHYERFAPQAPDGTPDAARGIRHFVVGTGGKNLYSVSAPGANSEARQASTLGVLRLELGAGTYSWEFVPVSGGTYSDAGSGSCH